MRFIFQKVADYGSSDPFVARMMMQNLALRDFVFPEESNRRQFDEFYSPVMANLAECRHAALSCKQLIDEHRRKLKSKEIIDVQPGGVGISESIDAALNKNFTDFFIKGEIAVQALNRLSRFMGHKMSFFSQTHTQKFEQGCETFLRNRGDAKGQDFIRMLQTDRQSWYLLFNDIRDKIEHEGFVLPPLTHRVESTGEVTAIVPLFNSKPLEETINLFWNNLFEFCEEVVVCLVNFRLEHPIIIVCVPHDQRDPEKPIKYRITMDPSHFKVS